MMLKENLDIPVGIIPSGTSNDFASYLVIEDNFDQYIENICVGKAQYVDVGSVGDEYFINVASAGMMTSVAHEVDTRLKNTFGKLAYYVRGIGELPRFRPLDFTIEADGEIFQEKIFFFIVINSPVVASFKNIADAKIDDGKLDMILLRHCSLPELMKIATDIIAGKMCSAIRISFINRQRVLNSPALTKWKVTSTVNSVRVCRLQCRPFPTN